jgi:amino acid transporter
MSNDTVISSSLLPNNAPNRPTRGDDSHGPIESNIGGGEGNGREQGHVKPVGDGVEASQGDIVLARGIGSLEVWALGLSIVIGGQYFSWNAGLSAGFGSFAISTLLIGSAYICLCLCNAEVSSALPFAGGAYGLARVSLGLYPGFLIGCCEAIEYIYYVASSAIVLAKMIVSITHSPDIMTPVYSLLFYISALLIHIYGGIWFWRTSTVLGVVSLLIIVIYCFGSLPWVDFLANAPASSTTGYTTTTSTNGGNSASASDAAWFIGGFSSFLSVMPLACWFYVGVESLNLGNASVEEVRIRLHSVATLIII